MHRILDTFVDGFVECRVDPAHDPEKSRLFWQSLGIPEAWLAEFSSLDPIWNGAVLLVHAPQMTEDLFTRIQALVAFPWRFQKHNAARCCVIGQGSRALLVSRLLGLNRIAKLAQEAPHASTYWFHHCTGTSKQINLAVASCTL